MLRMNKRLDPLQTGHEAEKLNADLHKRIVGQDDAIGPDREYLSNISNGTARTSHSRQKCLIDIHDLADRIVLSHDPLMQVGIQLLRLMTRLQGI